MFNTLNGGDILDILGTISIPCYYLDLFDFRSHRFGAYLQAMERDIEQCLHVQRFNQIKFL